jgi:hypothetical protein
MRKEIIMNASTPILVPLRIPFSETQADHVPGPRDVTKDIDPHYPGRVTAGLYALLKLWILVAFAGASVVAGSVAAVVDGRQSLRFGVAVIGIVLGGALLWASIRRMRVLLDRLDAPFTKQWVED